MWELAIIIGLLIGGLISVSIWITRDKTPKRDTSLSRLEWEELQVCVNRMESIVKNRADCKPLNKWLVNLYREEMYQ